MHHPRIHESENCPAVVYRDFGCTKIARKKDMVGWMVWGERLVVAVRDGNLWIPHNLIHKAFLLRRDLLQTVQ